MPEPGFGAWYSREIFDFVRGIERVFELIDEFDVRIGESSLLQPGDEILCHVK